VLLIQRESYWDELRAIVAGHHSVDTLFQELIAVFDLLKLLVVSRHDFYELVIFTLVAHNFDPVALILSCIVDQL
jgi:Na+-transporting NADH:ubiquinone oxidoreductase subunit NqrB